MSLKGACLAACCCRFIFNFIVFFISIHIMASPASELRKVPWVVHSRTTDSMPAGICLPDERNFVVKVIEFCELHLTHTPPPSSSHYDPNFLFLFIAFSVRCIIIAPNERTYSEQRGSRVYPPVSQWSPQNKRCGLTDIKNRGNSELLVRQNPDRAKLASGEQKGHTPNMAMANRR